MSYGATIKLGRRSDGTPYCEVKGVWGEPPETVITVSGHKDDYMDSLAVSNEGRSANYTVNKRS